MKNSILVLILASSLEASALMQDRLLADQHHNLMSEKSIDYTSENLNPEAIISVETTDVTEEYEEKRRLENANQNSKRLMGVNGLAHLAVAAEAVDKVDHIVEKVINIGQKVWAIVQKAQPVQQITLSKATALPQNAKSWDELENWKQPVSRVMRVSYRDVLGEVIRLDYRIILLAGGSSNGVGKYIGYAAVKVEHAEVSPRYTLNANVTIESVYNKGTRANPVAGMILVVDWSVTAFMKNLRASHTFYLDGMGRIDKAESNLLR